RVRPRHELALGVGAQVDDGTQAQLGAERGEVPGGQAVRPGGAEQRGRRSARQTAHITKIHKQGVLPKSQDRRARRNARSRSIPVTRTTMQMMIASRWPKS